MNIKSRLILLLCLNISFLSLSGQNITSDNAAGVFQEIITHNRLVDDFSSLGKGEASNLPIGIAKKIHNLPFTLAVTKIKFYNRYGEADLLLKLNIPQKSSSLIFGATGVKISYDGNLVGDVKLSLLSSLPVSLGKAGKFVLKGDYDMKTGSGKSDTYVVLECNGDIKEISVDGELILNPEIFETVQRADSITTDKTVKTDFKARITDWNDLLVDISMPRFKIKGTAGFEFEAKDVVFDFSDSRNSQVFTFPEGYKNNYFNLPDEKLWRGIYIGTLECVTPSPFRNTDSNTQMSISAKKVLLDENGLTFDAQAKNLLTLLQGSANGCPLSVNNIRLSMIANNIKNFGFDGEITLVDKKTRPYKAYIANDDYFFSVELGQEFKNNMFGLGTIYLQPSSYVEFRVLNGTFCPKVVLDGHMELNSGVLSMEQITFKKLALSTYAPYLEAEAIGYNGKVGLSGFPVSIDSILCSAKNGVLNMTFNAKVNLMDKKIAANSQIKIVTEFGGKDWSFKGVSVEKLKLEKVQLSGFELTGEIAMEKDHPIYGNYFGGHIQAKFTALSDALTVDVVSVFGNKDFRYWYVEGSVLFAKGVPVGPIFIDGFAGGAYYKMRSTGKKGMLAYTPDATTSLGVKAGVDYHIVDKSTINGNALFEMNFLASGGVQNIRFYAKANFLDVKAALGKAGEMYENLKEKAQDMSETLAAKSASASDGSGAAKNVITNIAGISTSEKDGIQAYATMEYDFPSKTFDASFRTMVYVAGGLLKGSGANNDAGSAYLHASPQKWFVKIGTPRQPVGLIVSLGPLSLKTSSYFMFGNIDEAPLPPDQALLNILGARPEDPDFMKFPDRLDSGKGVAFGTRMSFDTGNLQFLILYARFMAGAGIDILLQDMSNKQCKDGNGTIGINGWYAMGQCYAYLQGELGVRVKLLFIKKNISIIKGSTAALLQARMPNPTWVGGQFAVNTNVLGIIKIRMKMKLSFGDNCEIVSKDGMYAPVDFPIISDLSPSDNATDVDVFAIPEATLNMAEGTNISTEDEYGTTQTYRVVFGDFSVVDSQGRKVEGKLEWNDRRDVVKFISKDILTPNVNLKATVSVNFQEYQNGSWVILTQNGQQAVEKKEVSFKTGTAPNYIPRNNIEYMYPVIDQRNMFVGEGKAGYVQLKRGQPYLFPSGFSYNTIFASDEGQAAKSQFVYNSGTSFINYTLPTLSKAKEYTVSFIATSGTSSQSLNSGKSKTTSQQLTDGEGETYSLDIDGQVADLMTKEGGLEILKFNMRTSTHNTLSDKLSSLSFTPRQIFVNDDTRALFLTTNKTYELFDATELIGSDYTNKKPLIEVEAVLDDKYYKLDIAPLVYNWYPLPNITITGRDVNLLGVPPVRSMVYYDGYVSTVMSNTYNATISQTFPFVYNLPYIYYCDYYELQSKAVNLLVRNMGSAAYENYRKVLTPLINSHFLFIRQGDYKTKFRYVLPGAKEGVTTKKEINYINTLDWRK